MKKLDVLAAVLLVIGGVNWGLGGAQGIDLVAAVFGAMSSPSRLVHTLVGAAAVYQAFQCRQIQLRWLAPAPAGRADAHD